MASILTVSVESLASHVGIIDDGQGDRSDFERSRLLKIQLSLLQNQLRSQASRIYHEVAARYIPALMEKFRENSEPLTPSVTLLNVISHTPYFVRFLQTPAGQGIAELQAKRTVDAASSIISMPVDDIGEIGQFLSTLLVLQGIEGIDGSTKAMLIPQLKQWQLDFGGTLAAETSSRCIAQLGNNSEMRLMVASMKDMLQRSLIQCGVQGCGRKHQENGLDLMQCSRCKAAVYCGTDHQKQSWRQHKPMCFPSSF